VDSKPFSAHCLWREEYQLFVDSNPVSATVYGGKNNEYLWIPNQFPQTVFYGNSTILCTQFMREVNFLETEIGGKYKSFFMDSKKISANCFGRKNNNYLRIPNFPHTVMAGRTKIICGFQINFPTQFMAGRTTIICGFQTNFRTQFMAGRTTLISGFQTISCTLFMAGRTMNVCGFQTIFRLCLWREEQRLFSKSFSASVYGRKNNDYL
jgi:hypothetical protein